MAKVLFIQRQYFEYPGLMLISAVLKQHGHETDVLITSSPKRAVRRAAKYMPDVVGYPCTTGEHLQMLKIASSVKQAHPWVINLFGGHHAAFMADQLLENDAVDMVCVGEGEYPTLDLANAMDGYGVIDRILNLQVKIPSYGTIVRNDLRQLNDLDELPFADRELYKDYALIYGNTEKIFSIGRGCPMSCSFCYVKRHKEQCRGLGKYIRLRSVENVIAEIKQSGAGVVNIRDETFMLNREYALRLLAALKGLGIKLKISARFDELDEEIIIALRDAGCVEVNCGLESGVERLWHMILNKQLSDETVIRNAALLKIHGIKLFCSTIMGFPGEQLGDAMKTVEMLIELGADYPAVGFFHPYPGTALTDTAIRDGLLEADYADRVGMDYNTPYIKLKSKNRYVRLKRLALFTVLFPQFFCLLGIMIRLPLGPAYKMLDVLTRYVYFVRKSEKNLFFLIQYPLNKLHLDLKGDR